MSFAASSRRHFLRTSVAGLTGFALLAKPIRAAAAGSKLKILLRSSWQTVNIGDIAHTPGVLKLLEQYLPEAEVTLWPSSIDAGVEPLLRQRFPKLKFAVTQRERQEAIDENDFFLHGSGPSLVAQKDLARWVEQTDKPYGIYGITYSSTDEQARSLLSGAKFAYFRDSVSLAFAKSQGVTCPIMEFGPDGAFAVDLADDEKAGAFLKAHDLEQGKFLCCIPRLRYTPYWKIKEGRPFDQEKHDRNEAMKEHDHLPIRQAITEVVQKTSMKVLICPEDRSQMEVGKELLYDKLDADVRSKVVWRKDYWLTDEAISTYRRSAGLFGLEMHSPIMCIGNGIPAIVCRFNEQTSKGLMWRDIGLGDWLFDLDDPKDVERIVPTVLTLATDPAGAKQKAAAARTFVEQRQRETMSSLS